MMMPSLLKPMGDTGEAGEEGVRGEEDSEGEEDTSTCMCVCV